MASSSKSVSGLVGAFSSGDFYSFVVTGTQQVDLSVAFGDAELELYNSADSLISIEGYGQASTNGDDWTNEVLSPGTCYAEVSAEEAEDTAYTLTTSLGTPPVGTSTSNGGGASLSSAVPAGILSATPLGFLGWIELGNPTNTTDWYSFDLSTVSEAQITVAGHSSNVSVILTNASGEDLASASGSGSSNASILYRSYRGPYWI